MPCLVFLFLTYSFSYNWCDCPESNRDALRREILSLLCLPISPQSQFLSYLAGHEGFEPPPNGFGIRDATVTPMTHIMAEWTGLEPATPGVTGQCANQLRYHSIFEFVYRHTMSKSCAEPDSKYRLAKGFKYSNKCLGRLATHIWITLHT